MNLKMRNHDPIFVLGLQRGGTGLLQNILLSHPDVCKTRGELHEVFHGRRGGREEQHELRCTTCLKLFQYAPIVLLEGYDVFSINRLAVRKPFSHITASLVDLILYQEKVKARNANENMYKSEGVPYSKKEIQRSRLLCKNLNGLVFLTPNLQQIYPDAHFVAIVRNGFAVCEGQMRRGRSLRDSALLYEKCCRRIIEDNNRLPNYTMIRFEDVLLKPKQSVQKIMSSANLSLDKVTKIRLVGRQMPNKTRDNRLFWCTFDELADHIDPEIDRRQIQRLDRETKATIMSIAGNSMRHLGYS